MTMQNELEALRLENEELRRQLQEAQDENRAKETFLSNMSHDIRTPMNAIVGMTALAKKHIDEKARVTDALAKIEVASGHLLSLINDVLDMSRINSGRMQLSDQLFSLSDLLHDVLTIVRPQAEQKKHALRFDVGDILYEGLYGDPLRLRQIYVNIVNNAVKYTPEGGQIDLTVRQEETADRCVLIFECRDNGIGMTQEFLQRIFLPFERVNSSTISKIEGTGLGMSIVKKLVEAMGGEIALDSQVGQGTHVVIRTPLAYEKLQLNTRTLESKRLLILEADQAIQAVYRRYLTEAGLRYTVVTSAPEALDALTDGDYQGQPYDAALIGQRVEDATSALDVASYLRKSYPHLGLILISDAHWPDIEYAATRSGIEHFIPIPFFRKSLLNGLSEALQHSGGQSDPFAGVNLQGKRVLLVEDNEINREIAGELLSLTGAAVDMAVNGQEGLDRFLASENGWYDLILMDIQMPVMDGYTAAGQIRQADRPDAAAVPIIAMTANAFAEDIARARRAGMNGHIAKPIDINLFIQVLRQIQ